MRVCVSTSGFLPCPVRGKEGVVSLQSHFYQALNIQENVLPLFEE